MAEFDNIEFKDNVLNAYQSYTYHLTLTMINPENVDTYMDDSGAIKAEEQIVVAQSGSTTLLNIDNLDVQAVMAFAGGARDALGVRGQFVLSEPITFNLYRYLWSSLQSLNIKGSLSQARYILTVRFMSSTGEENFFYNDTKASVYSWPIMISTIDSTYGSAGEGSQHICNFVELGFSDLQDNLRLLKGINIKNCKTFGEAIKALEKKLYEQEFDDVQSNTPSKGVTDVFKITINYPALTESKWIQEKYVKYDQGRQDVFLEPTFTFKAGVSISNIIKTLWQATKISEQIVRDIEAQKSADKKAKNTNPADKMKADKKSKVKKSYRLKYYTLNSNIKTTVFDETRNDYGKYWDIQLDPYTVMDHRNDTKKETEAESIKSLEEVNASGHLTKFYRYQLTGLNTDVINLDMKFNTLYFLPSPPYDGMLATSGGTTQTIATLSQEKKDKAGIGPDGTIRVIVRNPPSGNRTPYAMAAPAFQVVNVEPRARQYKTINEDLPTKFAEEFSSKSNADEALQKNAGTYLTSKDSDEDNKTSQTQKSNYQLMNLENMADLLNIELEIRGDPYWFGRPRKVSPATSKNIQTAYPDYFKGGCYFLLDTRFGEEYNSDDGLVHTDQLDMFAGVYMVTTVTSALAGGVFTQYLKAIRMSAIKSSVVSKLLLKADSPPKETKQQEANAPEPGGGPG
jgi:transcriptional antiterminator Rof (Rho-off)